MSETRARTSAGPRRFMGGAAISANRTAPSWLALSVSNAIGESPEFDGWLGPPAAAQRMGRRLTAPAAAEAARTLRRVGNEKFTDMAGLLASTRAGVPVPNSPPLPPRPVRTSEAK